MIKETQTTRRLFPTNCLGVFDHFVGLVLKILTETLAFIIKTFKFADELDTPSELDSFEIF